MLSKKEVKDIQSLDQKKFRDESGLFVAEGPKIVAELLNAIPNQVEKVYATSEWISQHPTLTSKVQVVNDIELQRISHLQTPNQVLAVIRQLQWPEPEVKDDFYIYLDTIQDPGNLGTIIRIADWFGVKGVVCTPGCADVYNSKVVQSTMASIARIPVWYDAELQWLQKQPVNIYAATLHGRSLYQHPKAAAGVLIIGNESKGIRPEVLERATDKITIPRKGQAESLNAAVATGIVLSHLLS